MSIDFKQLQEPFPAHQVHWRLQRRGTGERGLWARVVPYVDVRFMYERLDRVCGPANWRTDERVHESMLLVGLALQSEDGWVTKWDGTGYKQPSDSGGGLSEEDAKKATFTVGFRRAAAQWGIARYVIYIPDQPATCYADARKGQYWGQLKDKTEFSWDPPTLPDWALPGGSGLPPEGSARKQPAEGRQRGDGESPPKPARDAGRGHDAPIPCLECGGPMYDNRDGKKPRAPDFVCKNRRGCGGKVWLDGWAKNMGRVLDSMIAAGKVEDVVAVRARAAVQSGDPHKMVGVHAWLRGEDSDD